jgi:preprotein translocase subunit SecB
MAENNVDNQQDTVDKHSRSPFRINDQYIKDLSFENPNFLFKYQNGIEQPQVAVNVETNVAKLQEAHYEVAMKVGVKSFAGQKDIFILEVIYGAFVIVDPSLGNEVLEPILLVHCPFLMFPFVRNIVADISRNGGYPPLLIEPIDFASLYLEKRKNEDAKLREEDAVKN